MNVFEECLKCQKDFSYFAENYLKVLHPTRGLVSLPLYDYQRRLVESYDENRFVVVKKFRQGGFSTVTVLYGLWQCMFHMGKKFLFITKTDYEAVALGIIVRHAVQQLPDELKPFLTLSNDHHKVFKCTNSEMWFLTPVAACAKSFTNLVVDEAAFIPGMDEHWITLWQALVGEGKCFVVSTVNGVGNWYERLYTCAVEGKNEFKAFDCHYAEHPDYNKPEWVAKVKRNLGERAWAQEMECRFVGSTPTR